MRDFVDAVDEVQRCLREKGLNYKIADICRIAASMPAPRFYTDANTALKQYNLYLRGRSSIHSKAKRMMYAEIFARFEKSIEALAASGQYIRKVKVMESILEQPAPSFYYDDNSALKMYYYIMSQKRRKKIV